MQAIGNPPSECTWRMLLWVRILESHPLRHRTAPAPSGAPPRAPGPLPPYFEVQMLHNPLREGGPDPLFVIGLAAEHPAAPRPSPSFGGGRSPREPRGGPS